MKRIQRPPRQVAIPLTWLVCISLISCEATSPEEPAIPEFEHIVIADTLGGLTFTNVADISGDGFLDVLAFKTGEDGFMSWYEYPSYEQHFVRHGAFEVGRPFAADMDLDGDIDIVAGKVADRHIYWFENPGPARSVLEADNWVEHLIGSTKLPSPNDYIKDYGVDDFDGDGLPDLVVCTFDDPAEIFIYFQNGADDWHKTTHLYENGHEGLDIGDLDGDGDPDVVVNGRWFETPDDPRNNALIEHEIDEKWHNQSGSWQRNATMVKVADIDGDGNLDVVISHSEMEDYPLSWYNASDPKGKWIEHQIDMSYGWCQTLEIGDVDLDGHLDILAARFTRPSGVQVPPPHDVRIYYYQGPDAGSWTRQVVSPDKSMYFGHLADIDNDGDLDIIGPRSYWTGPLEIWENTLDS
jgi:hypothetical protein